MQVEFTVLGRSRIPVPPDLLEIGVNATLNAYVLFIGNAIFE